MNAPLIDLAIHHRPKGASDRIAYGFVKALRLCADTFFAKRYGHRAVVLETVAAVPGMVGATLNHLKCLRRMEDDRGWIKTLMDEAENDVLAFMTFPRAHWSQIYSTNPLERLNAEIKRRTNVVGIFPNDASIVRLVGAMMLEQNDEWSLNRRYMQLEGLQTVSDTAPTRLPAVAR